MLCPRELQKTFTMKIQQQKKNALFKSDADSDIQFQMDNNTKRAVFFHSNEAYGFLLFFSSLSN